MTNRERLLRFLSNQELDRTPIWLLFPYHKVGYYADVRTNPLYHDLFEMSKTSAVMLDRRNLQIPLHAQDVVSRETSARAPGGSNGVADRRSELSCRGRTLYWEIRHRDGDTTHKKLVCNDEDLETYLEFPVETDRKVIEANLAKRLPAYLAEKAEFPEAYGSMMLDLGEPIGPLYHAAELTEYPIWSLTHPEAIRRYLDRAFEYYRIKYEYCLKNDLADVYFMVGSEMASPPMVSRQTFQQWIVPYSTELCRLVHSYGKHVIQHYHGQIREILPDFLTMGADALHTIEAPPVGNCTLPQAFDVVGDRIGLIGNIQYDCFRSYTPVQMREAVRDVLREAAGRRFMLSPTAGPYEHTISPAMQANYLEFMKAGVEFGAR